VGVSVTWQIAAASVVGSSHLVRNTECQDDCYASEETTSQGESILSIFVADGAGSAVNGGGGARKATEIAAAFVSEAITAGTIEFSAEFFKECAIAVRKAIAKDAEEASQTPRDFACTFLGVIVSDSKTLVMQIGDGGIVVDVGDGLEVAVVPMGGEYANMTHFITDEDAPELLVIKAFDKPATRVAAFSDGIQRLALNMAENTPYEPFFTPFFEVLAKSNPEQRDSLTAALDGYLQSELINSRTDDDKTLAIAVKTV
jgi:hypothetical protein